MIIYFSSDTPPEAMDTWSAFGMEFDGFVDPDNLDDNNEQKNEENNV